MLGPFCIDRKKPLPSENKGTEDFILMFSDWASKWAFKPGYGGVPGDVYDYFTLNAKSYPDTQPLMVKKGDFIRLRLIRSEEHTSELQSLMRISYAVFCLKKKNKKNHPYNMLSTNTHNINNHS